MGKCWSSTDMIDYVLAERSRHVNSIAVHYYISVCPITREGFFMPCAMRWKKCDTRGSPQRRARRLFAGLNHMDEHNTRLFTVTDGKS